MALAAVADPERAVGAMRFFKTGPGQYGEGDVFIGVRVPDVRAVVKRFAGPPLSEVDVLMRSDIHEHRLAGLLILLAQFERASRTSRTSRTSHTGHAHPRDDAERTALVDYYLELVHRNRVNNWDLVDASAPGILGAYLVDRPRDVLFELAASDVLWHRRVAMVSTLGLIQAGDASTTLELAALLLDDTEPLMHKAVGWALREVGKRIDRDLLIRFLDEYAKRMPRTALSYATEHLSPEQRQAYRQR